MRKLILITILILSLVVAGCASNSGVEKGGSPLDNNEASIIAEETKDDFIYRLVSESGEYPDGEAVKMYAELEYIGDKNKVTIYHASSPFYYNMTEKTREFEIQSVMPMPLLNTTLKKNQPFREEYKRSGGYSLDDDEEYANFMKKFLEDGFPKGHYVVDGNANFYVETTLDGEVKQTDYRISAQIEFKVGSKTDKTVRENNDLDFAYLINADIVNDDQWIVAGKELHSDDYSLKRVNLKNKTVETIYSTEKSIFSLNTSLNGKYTALYMEQDYSSNEKETPLYILNQNGEVIYELPVTDANTWGNVKWSPVQEELCLITVSSAGGPSKVIQMNVATGEEKVLPFEGGSVNWDHNIGVVYEGPPIESELTMPRTDMNYYHFEDGDLGRIEAEGINVFATYSNRLLIAASAQIFDGIPEVTFSSYNLAKNNEKQSIIELPGLLTESEWHWIPPFDYDPQKNELFYIKVDSPSGYLLTNDNHFQLYSIHLASGKDQQIVEVKNPIRFKISPDGMSALIISEAEYGSDQEPGNEIYWIDIDNKKAVSLEELFNMGDQL